MLTKKQCKRIAKKYDVELNGCGNEKWKKLVPNKAWWLWGVSLKLACLNHDLRYGLGGSEKLRKVADKLFKNDIRELIHNHWFYKMWSWRPSVKARARMTEIAYYRAVRYGGKDSYYQHYFEDNWDSIIFEETL